MLSDYYLFICSPSRFFSPISGDARDTADDKRGGIAMVIVLSA